MNCKCGANLYRVSGLTRYDNRDGIREASWCDSCYTLFSSHAFGLSEIGKLTDTNKIDQLRTRIAELEAEVERLNAHAVEVYKEQRKAYLELEAKMERLRKSLKHFADKAFLADTDGDLKTMSNFQSGGLFIADHVAKIAKKALGGSDENRA